MKRMFDKEEIVEIAKEGGSITVDSELSSTSENPVQNKVIYEALQNVGGGKYVHVISMVFKRNNVFNFTLHTILVTIDSESYTKDNIISKIPETSISAWGTINDHYNNLLYCRTIKNIFRDASNNLEITLGGVNISFTINGSNIETGVALAPYSSYSTYSNYLDSIVDTVYSL